MDNPNMKRLLLQTKTRSTPRIDVEEQLTHVRTVHFALLALCFILLAAILLNRDTEVTRAIAQLTTLNNGLQRWNPTWLQNLLLHDSAGVMGAYKTTRGPWLLQGSEKRPAISVERPPLERTLWPLPASLADLVKQPRSVDWTADTAPELKNQPQNLAEFKELWNALNTTIAVHELEDISNQASVYGLRQRHREAAGTRAIVPLTQTPVDGAVCRVKPRLTYLRRAENMPEVMAVKSDAPFVHLLHGYCHDPDSNDLLWSASIEVTVRDAQTFNAQSTFLEAHRIDAPLGPYERSFPDLARVTANYDDLGFEKLFAVLSAEAARAGDRVELFGAKLPGGGIALWGLPLLCILQLYLLLHVEALSENVQTAPADGFVSWIGVYQSIPARVTTVASASILPFLTGLLLRYTDTPPGQWVSSGGAWGLTATLAISFILTTMTWRAIRRVRHTAAHSAESLAQSSDEKLTEGSHPTTVSNCPVPDVSHSVTGIPLPPPSTDPVAEVHDGSKNKTDA